MINNTFALPFDMHKDKIWLFNSADTFSGNVKYLFLYISRYRPDIFACYISANKANVEYIRSLGFHACEFRSQEGTALMKMAGVYVNEHCKESYPEALAHAKILNLYHGVGLKQIEKKADREFLSLRIAKKHIQYSELFSNNMCFLVTSPFMESHFKAQLDLSDNQLIRAGYPRNLYQTQCEPVATYDHDILAAAGLPAETKIALYAPTFREKNPKNFLYSALQDIAQLSDTLTEKNMCLILKLHPEISNDFYFKTLSESCGRYKNIILWDNRKDIYEIFPKIDLAIVDYSSIFYDLLYAGVKNFIRYIFDYDDEKHTMIYSYEENTTGLICRSFDELLTGINEYDSHQNQAESEAISDKFWLYSSPDSFEQIIAQTMDFHPGAKQTLPDFYSFDIFDTLLARDCLQPKGIFVKVMENIRQSDEGFPAIFATQYPEIRMQAEANLRERLRKTTGEAEITFAAIFTRLSEVYALSDRHIQLLADWEIESELASVIPLRPMIEQAEQLIRDGEKVVLISDMYLPTQVIAAMLAKVSDLLGQIPLYVSAEYGVQKATSALYLAVYKAHAPWRFKAWHHYGDNKKSDGIKAQEIGIKPHIHAIPQFNAYEKSLVSQGQHYDSYLLAATIARMRSECVTVSDQFTCSQISAYLVPYVAWCVRDALAKGIETLYFISRDGHFLKKIADHYISLNNFPIKTKYLYGSRKAWRVPALIDRVDDEFFTHYGNLVAVNNYSSLLAALNISHTLYQRMFPDTGINEKSIIDAKTLVALRDYFSKSSRYHQYLLEKAHEQRELVNGYLRQEIDFSEKYAFVEYWARGYTQTCLANLINSATGEERACTFYYYRSILPSEAHHMRLNYSTITHSLIPVEAIFANSPHGTVLGYQQTGDRIEPVVERIPFDSQLYWSMENYLEKFIRAFYALPFTSDLASVEQMFSAHAFSWYAAHQDDALIVSSLGHLRYSEASSGNLNEFAPALTQAAVSAMKNGKLPAGFTRSLPISLARSTPALKKAYHDRVKGKVHAALNGPVKAGDKVRDNGGQKNRKSRLRHKLEVNPQRFYADSNHSLIRLAGKAVTHPLTRNNMGRVIVKLSQLALR